MELAFDKASVIVAVLRFQGLLQSEQRARIARIAIEVGAKNFLCARSIAIDQQDAT